MATIIFLTPELIAQARSRESGRHLAAPKQPSLEDHVKRQRHAQRMLAFAMRAPRRKAVR